MARAKRNTMAIALIAFLGLAASAVFVSGRAFADDPVGRATSVEDALRGAPFDVARPRALPFSVESSFGVRGQVGEKVRVEQTYVGQSGYVAITAIQGPVTLGSKRLAVVQVALSDGSPAQFLDNGAAQILVWTRDDVSYHLAVARKDGTQMRAADLIKIADSMQ